MYWRKPNSDEEAICAQWVEEHVARAVAEQCSSIALWQCGSVAEEQQEEKL